MAYPATDARYFDTSASSLGSLFVFRAAPDGQAALSRQMAVTAVGSDENPLSFGHKEFPG